MPIPHVIGQHAFISLCECTISNLFFYAENSVPFPEVFWRKTAYLPSHTAKSMKIFKICCTHQAFAVAQCHFCSAILIQ